jgi:hypothetical protein
MLEEKTVKQSQGPRNIPRWLRFLALVAISLFSACGQSAAKRETDFLASFSARDAINQISERMPNIRVGAVERFGTSSTLDNRSFNRRDEVAELQLSSTSEHSFLEDFKSKIQQMIENSGSKIIGEGSGNGSFSFDYTDGRIHGWIDVFQVRGAGENYKLIILARES